MTLSYAVPISAVVARQPVVDDIFFQRAAPPPGGVLVKLRAWWEKNGVRTPLTKIVSFSATVSARGVGGSIVLTRAAERNPRAAGAWAALLKPADDARILVSAFFPTEAGEIETPLVQGVPSPGGITENHGRRGDTIEIRFEDVAAVLARMPAPGPAGGGGVASVLPRLASGAFNYGGVPVTADFRPNPAVCNGACLPSYDSPLRMLDDLLATRQDAAANTPSPGYKTVRFGTRGGGVLYTHLANADAGGGFPARFPGPFFTFTYLPRHILDGAAVTEDTVRITVPHINPYIDLGDRLTVKHPAAALDEMAEVTEITYGVSAREERMGLVLTRNTAI